jgi:NAD(P)-dependent dehydrogenase (short-subunit alcohol dehydrogenase family)
MTLLAAREFAGRGIRVNTIVAGGFDPPILDVTGREAAAGQIQFFANPRRLGTSEEFPALAACRPAARPGAACSRDGSDGVLSQRRREDRKEIDVDAMFN